MTKKNSILIQIGCKVRLHRKRLGFSQETFATHIGVDRSYMGRIERGERNITILTLFKIIKAFDLTYKEFFEDMHF